MGQRRPGCPLEAPTRPPPYLIAAESSVRGAGHVPRLLLIWTCTEATQKQSRELLLGDSLSAFLEKVGIPKGGGPRTRLREQMDRAFHSAFPTALRRRARQEFHFLTDRR